MPEMTLLAIDGIMLGDYAVRDLTMTLAPIDQAFRQRRNINGQLINVAMAQFQGKRRARIECTDQESPVFVGVAIGTQVTVTCVPQLGNNALDSDGADEQQVITMLVQPWSVSRAEWQAQSAWALELEEV